jgi:hypothetical protein
MKVIEEFRKNPEMRVLASTEVGSEGLDFQFCSVVVNYDLPWNPMVLEQRIGRIDRFGQQAERLQIFSLVVSGTVEDRILERVYHRIGICERSLGSLEVIIGDEVNEIRKSLFFEGLSNAELERKAEQNLLIIEQRELEIRALEEEAVNLVGHEHFIMGEVDKVQRLGRYLTAAQIHTVLGGYLDRRHPDIRIRKVSEDVWKIPLTHALLSDVDQGTQPLETSSAMGLRARSREDGALHFTTDGELAFESNGIDLLNASHPLVRTAAESLKPLMEAATSRVAAVRISAEVARENDLRPGVYFVQVSCIDVKAVKSKRLLECFVVSSNPDMEMDGEQAERFVFLCQEGGEAHPSTGTLPPLSKASKDALSSLARGRKLLIENRERDENKSLRERRWNSFNDERERKLKSKERAIETCRRNNRSERMIKLAEAARDKVALDFDRRERELEEGREVRVDLLFPPLTCSVVEVCG